MEIKIFFSKKKDISKYYLEGLDNVINLYKYSKDSNIHLQLTKIHKIKNRYNFTKKYIYQDSAPFFEGRCSKIIRILLCSLSYKNITKINIDYTRLDSICEQVNINYSKNWNYNQSGYILICTSNSTKTGWHNNGFNLNNIEIVLKNIRKFTNKKIILRLHPSDIKNFEQYRNYIEYLKKTYEISCDIERKRLKDNLKNIYCAICDKTSLGPFFIFYGIPVFNFQSNFEDSCISKICLTKYELLNNFKIADLPDRMEYLHFIANQTYTINEIKNGYMFKRIYPYLF